MRIIKAVIIIITLMIIAMEAITILKINESTPVREVMNINSIVIWQLWCLCVFTFFFFPFFILQKSSFSKSLHIVHARLGLIGKQNTAHYCIVVIPLHYCDVMQKLSKRVNIVEVVETENRREPVAQYGRNLFTSKADSWWWFSWSRISAHNISCSRHLVV